MSWIVAAAGWLEARPWAWPFLAVGFAAGWRAAARVARWRREVERDLDLSWQADTDRGSELSDAERAELVRQFRECWARERSARFEQGE